MSALADLVKKNTKTPAKSTTSKSKSGSALANLASQPKQRPSTTKSGIDVSKHVANPLNPGSKEYLLQMEQRAPQQSMFKNFVSSVPGAVKTILGLDNNAEGLKQFGQGAAIVGKLPGYAADVATKVVTAPIAITDPKKPIPFNKGKGLVEAYKRAPNLTDVVANIASDATGGNPTAAGVGGFVGESLRQALGMYLLGNLGDRIATKTGGFKASPKQVQEVLANPKIEMPAPVRAELSKYAKTGIEQKTFKPASPVRQILGQALGGGPKTGAVVNAPGEAPLTLSSESSALARLNAPQSAEIAPGEAIAPKGSIATPKGITYNPIEEKPIQTPEIKTSKLAQGVEQKAIEKKLTDGFEGKPEYAKVNVADQAKAASSLLNTSREQAINVAMGHELPPEGILPESVFVAVENHAIQTKDVELLRQLATSSNLTTEATGMGQRIRMLAERDPNSAVTAMRKVQKIREEAATKKVGDIKKAKAKIKTEIKTEVIKAAPKAKDWAGFLEEIKCR
jgi:hypothetical protein